MQFKICEFWTLFHFFVYDHGPSARAPHIANDFFLQIRSPNKYIAKVDKRWFIRHNGFCARYKNVPGGLRAPPALNWVKGNFRTYKSPDRWSHCSHTYSYRKSIYLFIDDLVFTNAYDHFQMKYNRVKTWAFWIKNRVFLYCISVKHLK